jgi:hypothetical protein
LTKVKLTGKAKEQLVTVPFDYLLIGTGSTYQVTSQCCAHIPKMLYACFQTYSAPFSKRSLAIPQCSVDQEPIKHTTLTQL